MWFLYVLFLLFIVWGAILPRINKNRNYVLLLVVVLLLGKLVQYIEIGDLFLYKEFLFYSFSLSAVIVVYLIINRQEIFSS